MKKIKKFILLSIFIYIILFLVVFLPLGAFQGSDIVGGTFTYVGLIILSSVILYTHEKQ